MMAWFGSSSHPMADEIQNQFTAVNNSNVLQGTNEGSKQCIPLPIEKIHPLSSKARKLEKIFC